MRVIFHKYFDKSYKNCSSKIQRKFKERLKIFMEDQYSPILENHALYGEWKDFRSINITGDYRALYHYLDFKKGIVEFFLIDTHSNLYN